MHGRMASIQPRGTKWQVRIKRKLLPRPLFVAFDDEHSASAYARHIEAMLDSTTRLVMALVTWLRPLPGSRSSPSH